MWILFVFAAATLQVARNALQSSLTGRLGTVGATHVRFLYGLPFGALFLGLIVALQGPPATLSAAFFAWIFLGAIAQIGATALLLCLMQTRSFVVSTAYIKTEPVLVAIFGLVVLGDRLPGWSIAGVIIATLGVVILSWPRSSDGRVQFQARAAILGIASAALFALAAIGFRGGILTLGDAPYALRAAMGLLAALTIQTLCLTLYLRLFDGGRLTQIVQAWRPSLLAGFAGAAASLCWFLAFALETAAHVRTLALVEILIAGLVSRRYFRQALSRSELVGIGVMMAGLAAILASPLS